MLNVYLYTHTHTHNTFLQQIKCKQSRCSVSLLWMLLHRAPRSSQTPFIALFRTSLNIYPPLCRVPAISNNRLGVFLFASFRSSTFRTETKEAVMRYISAEWLMNKWWFLKWIPLRFPLRASHWELCRRCKFTSARSAAVFVVWQTS